MAEIETYVVPRYLYRYRSLAQFKREMECIETANVYCANFKAMNDPMEGFYSESKLLAKSSDVRNIRLAITSGKMMIGMCAFSEVFNHELMWAHYADQFGGICIAYDFFKLRHHLPPDVTFTRIYYNEEMPRVGLTKKPKDHLNTAKTILSYKNHRWLYEREWRMFANDIGPVNYNDARCVARVYIGARVNQSIRTTLEKSLKHLKIPCRAQKLDGYAMRFEPLAKK